MLILQILLSLIAPISVWLYFLLKLGGESNPNLWGYYLLLCPLLLYLLFFISYFQKKQERPLTNPVKKIFRITCLALLTISLLDAVGAYVNRALYQHKIDQDWRYNIFINDWIQKRRLQLPPTSGDTEPGPFLPHVKGKIIDSSITADRWGFRREIEDMHPGLEPEDTFNALCLGGSVMFGMTVHQDDLPAPDMLQKMFYDNPAQETVRVYNAAFPGAHAGSITQPEQTSYWRIKPDVILFYEAINWLVPGQKTFLLNRNSLLMTIWHNLKVRRESIRAVKRYIPDEFGAKIEYFILQCRENNPDVIPVLITFALPFTEHDAPQSLSYWDVMQNGQGCARAAAIQVRKHNQRLRDIARKYNIPLIDSLPMLNGKPDFFIDSCHLTRQGNRILAQLMEKVIRDIINQRSKKT